MQGMGGAVENGFERLRDLLWKGQPSSCAPLGEARSVSSAAAAGRWLGKPALEAQGPPLTSDCSRGIYERGKEERLKLCAGFLSSLAPPSPAKEGGTFVARAFLERSCDFSGLGTEGYA